MKVGIVLNVVLSPLLLLLLLCCAIYGGDCRQAVKPAPDIGEVLQENANIVGGAGVVIENGPPCTLNIQKDLPTSSNQPLYLTPDTSDFWLPNGQGFLQVPRGARIELYCSKAFANHTNTAVPQIPKNTRILQPICLQDNTFYWQGQKYKFHEFICAHPPKYVVEHTGVSCGKAGIAMPPQLYRVGFNITHERFAQTMLICHDDTLLRTQYTQHQFVPASLHFQMHVKRQDFSKAGHFVQHNMHQLYKKENQRQMALTLLTNAQINKSKPLIDERTFFLTRGHLAAKADQIYASQQRSTFTYFNVAPQWQSFNGGQWAAVEVRVRQFVHRAKLLVDSYTGTWGTLRLAGNATEFYLTHDANNNGLLPVPQLFYRVLIDRGSGRGIAVLGVNDPHASLKQIHAEYVICEDISAQIDWLRWIRNENLLKGYIYACEVQNFLRVVDHLPQHLANVTELLTEA